MNKDSVWGSFWKNTLPQYGITFAQYFVPFLTLPYLTRVLGIDVYGQVVLLTAVAGYLQLFTEFGFNLSATTTVSRHRSNLSKIAQERQAVFQSRLILAVLTFALFLFLIQGANLFSGFEQLAMMYGASAVLAAFVPVYLFRGLELMPTLSAILILSRLVFAASIFLFVRTSDDVLWVPLSNLIGTVFVISFTALYAKFKLALPRKRVSLKASYQVARSSFPYFVDAIASTVFGALTILYLSASNLSLRDVALWGAAYQLISTIQSLYTPVIVSVLPRMSRTLDWAFLRRVLSLFMPIIGVGCIVLYVVADVMIGLIFGPEFVAASSVLRSLIPVLLFSFPALILGAPVLGAMGRQSAVASSTIVSSVLFLGALGILWGSDNIELLLVGILRSLTELFLVLIRIQKVRLFLK